MMNQNEFTTKMNERMRLNKKKSWNILEFLNLIEN